MNRVRVAAVGSPLRVVRSTVQRVPVELFTRAIRAEPPPDSLHVNVRCHCLTLKTRLLITVSHLTPTVNALALKRIRKKRKKKANFCLYIFRGCTTQKKKIFSQLQKTKSIINIINKISKNKNMVGAKKKKKAGSCAGTTVKI